MFGKILFSLLAIIATAYFTLLPKLAGWFSFLGADAVNIIFGYFGVVYYVMVGILVLSIIGLVVSLSLRRN